MEVVTLSILTLRLLLVESGESHILSGVLVHCTSKLMIHLMLWQVRKSNNISTRASFLCEQIVNEARPMGYHS